MYAVSCMNTTLESDELHQHITLGFYTISIICSTLLLLLLALNIKQLSTVDMKINHPLKKPRVVVVMQCAAYLMINQLIHIMIQQHCGGNGNRSRRYRLDLPYTANVFEFLLVS